LDIGMAERVYIGLGSNLEQPVRQVTDAIEELKQLPGTRLAACSRLYRSRPMGPADQPDYINAVAMMETELEPGQLLDRLQAIEHRHKRIRGRRWGARTLDLDVLLFGDRVIETARLLVPHPGISERAFVLYPMREIADGGLNVPGLGDLDSLVAGCSHEGLEPYES
jgi:2-amino-4-hydroxy-6-hydroxymethyldihydropteridine diphosphokinase